MVLDLDSDCRVSYTVCSLRGRVQFSAGKAFSGSDSYVGAGSMAAVNLDMEVDIADSIVLVA